MHTAGHNTLEHITQQKQTNPRDALHHANGAVHKDGRRCDKLVIVVGRLLTTFATTDGPWRNLSKCMVWQKASIKVPLFLRYPSLLTIQYSTGRG